jgi:CBS domain containing-hemolysin-like protein
MRSAASMLLLAPWPALPAAPDSSGFLGWGAADLPMLVALAPLLVLSGFFSCSETALFALSDAQRLALRTTHPRAGRAVDLLLGNERMLLITILTGNMTVNVLYWVISSVLMLRSVTGAATEAGLAVGFLVALVILGEAGPKFLASAARERVAPVCAPLLLPVHRAIAPLRLALDRLVIDPLSRLTSGAAPPPLADAELKELVDVSSTRGVIDAEEQRLLRGVITAGRLKVAGIMTPRVHTTALPLEADRAAVERATRETRLTRIPVYDGDLDHVVGILDAKRFLLDRGIDRVGDPRVLTPAHFVPAVATVEQLLEQLRGWHAQSAIVVNEYGGTEGIVAVEDVVEEIVGDILAAGEEPVEPPRLVGIGCWSVAGDLGAHEFAEAFSVPDPAPRVTTVGGMIAERLGRAPQVGDVVAIEHLAIEVREVERSRVARAEVRMAPRADEGGADGEPVA